MTRLGKGWVNDLTFSPNGKILSVATSIGVYLYQIESMELMSFLPGNANVIDTVFIDDKTLAVGDSNGTTTVWDIGDTPEILETLQRTIPVAALGVFEDGSILIVEFSWKSSGRGASPLVNVVKWDRVNPENVFEVSSEIGYRAEFSPSRNVLVLKNATQKIILVDTKRMKATGTICFDCGGITLSDTSGIMATTRAKGDKREIVLFDISSQEELTSFQNPGGAWDMAFSFDGRWLATASPNALNLWDVTAAELVDTFEGAVLVSLSPEGKMLASISQDGKLILRELPGGEVPVAVEGFSPINNAVFNNGYFAAREHSKYIILGDINSGEIIRTISPIEENLFGPFSFVFSDDGNTIASTWLKPDYTVAIVLFDVLTGEQLTLISGGDPLAFSPDGSLLAYGTLLSGEAPHAGYLPDYFTLSYHPQQTQLMIWDIAAGEPLPLDRVLVPGGIQGPYMQSLVFSPDGASIALIAEPVILRDLLTGKPMMTLESGLDPLDGAAEFFEGEGPIGEFSPDGKILATTWLVKTRDDFFRPEPKGIVILWDVTNGEKAAILDGHANPMWDEFGRNPITALAFSPDGTLLASGAKDKTIIFWNVRDRSMIEILEGHSASVDSLSFSSDGKYLYSGSLDQYLRQNE